MEGSMLAEEVDTNNEECFRKRPRRWWIRNASPIKYISWYYIMYK
jgi:hypothetical protein